MVISMGEKMDFEGILKRAEKEEITREEALCISSKRLSHGTELYDYLKQLVKSEMRRLEEYAS